MERITPEEALKRCKKEEEEEEKIKRKIGKGDLKIFVGYSPGVGKTYSMLNEGNDRLKNGENTNYWLC